MELKGKCNHFNKELRGLLLLYLIITSIGFFSSLQFVQVTTTGTPKGIEENYLGNEADFEAEEMKFAKTEKQILNIVHAHMLSMGMLFFILSLILATTPIGGFWRKFLLFEPLVSVFLTFGGIYFLWKGILWMKYIIMISGGLMTLSYIISMMISSYHLVVKKTAKQSSGSPSHTLSNPQ